MPNRPAIDGGDHSDALGIWHRRPAAFVRSLLDSHAVYWWMTGSVRLSDTARALIVDDTNTLLVRAVSIYEIELKAKRRRVDLPPQELRAALRRNIVEELAITHDHAGVCRLSRMGAPRSVGPSSGGSGAPGKLRPRVC